MKIIHSTAGKLCSECINRDLPLAVKEYLDLSKKGQVFETRRNGFCNNGWEDNLVIYSLGKISDRQGILWLEKDKEACSFFDDELELGNTLAFIASLLIKFKGIVVDRTVAETMCKESLQEEGAVVFQSALMHEVIKKAYHFSCYDVPVLITGETGTGKEEIARIIHKNSLRKQEPFVVVNCGAIPETLFESELFGHKKGAFTTALFERTGLLKEADEGTLFFDEIADLAIGNQVKLLRVIENHEYRPVGGNNVIMTKSRFVFATNKSLETLRRDNLFREDLFYRIGVAKIHVPPLRERKEDISLLFKYFIKKYCTEMGAPELYIKNSILHCIEEYPWPGNVRELSNIARQIILWHKSQSHIDMNDLPEYMKNATYNKVITFPDSWQEAKNTFSRDYVLRILEQCKYNKTKASTLLKISRWGLRKLLKRLDIAG